MDNRHFSIGEVKELSTMIADHLVEMIQSGVLKPRERLVQTDLAEQFGVSRIAVRDALHKLIRRGLAVKIPRKGIMVRPVSCKIIRDIIAVRRVLEILAAREACSKMTDEDLERLDNIIQEQEILADKVEPTQLIKKDWEFHMSLYDGCDNETLKDIIVDLWSRMRQAQGLAQVNVEWGERWVKHSVAFHRRILDALRRRDANSVEQLITESLNNVEERLIQALKEVPWVDGSSGKQEMNPQIGAILS
jgi:DNA-binding GntR family transcriptional regulator